ncbi:amino acid ABC transporter permease [Desulfocurvus sp.]|jgi:polar amino acid transport system permease protein|uniref:amino acid ABC transporter permease n=1 Tax=Desulfocurvus sp. TaxID=2871698 RepID=UPI0025BD3EC0|nr:amino acid ABC transporter permease [Desulfocurvus sp.]MCK9239911.1 amino acid ABC transporter permease [Desulfocurvus sp.]
MNFEKALRAIIDSLPYMLGGVWVTVGLIVGALALGFVLGVPLAVIQVYGRTLARRLVVLYVWLFRGVPILVLIFLFYFGILPHLGLDSAFLAGVIVLGLTSAAYQSQIFRGAIQSLPAGQLKAARALGMTDTQAISCIVLPQALRLSIPGWSNEFSILLKDSALVMVISVQEIMARTRSVAGRTHEPVAMALFAGVLFFILTWIGLRLLRGLERRVRIKGYSQEGSV